MSTSQERHPAQDDPENLAAESADPEQEPEQERLPKGTAAQSATGTGSIKVTG